MPLSTLTPTSAPTESVWDYPRPPRVEPTAALIRVVFNGVTLAETNQAIRLLETSHPPVYYIPQSDVNFAYLKASNRSTFCEWKGRASYLSVKVGDREAQDAAWTFLDPQRHFPEIRNYLAFYADKMDACFVDDMRVSPQDGNFYGGWITENIVGPFKGGPGTWGW